MKIEKTDTRNPGINYKEWEQLLLCHVNDDDIFLIVSEGAKCKRGTIHSINEAGCLGDNLVVITFQTKHHETIQLPRYERRG